MEWKEFELENDDLQDYKAKAEFYICQHQDNEVIAKLRSNVPLNADDAKALRFDALMYRIELAYLVGKKYAKARNDLVKKVNALANTANIPEIMSQHDLINKILHTDHVETAGINEFENIREQ